MNSRLIPWLFMAPALALIAIVTVYPMIYSMIISFQDVRLTRINQAEFVGSPMTPEFSAILHFIDRSCSPLSTFWGVSWDHCFSVWGWRSSLIVICLEWL